MTTATTIDVKAFVDERPKSPYQCLLVALCFLVVVADGMDVAIVGFVAPPILQEWDISRPAFGLVMSATPIGLVIGALIAGPLVRSLRAQDGPDHVGLPVRRVYYRDGLHPFAD